MVYSFNLKSKVIILTGGYGHLGKSITESLVHHNAIVYILGRRQSEFNSSFSNLLNQSTNLYFIECDVSRTESLKNAFEKVFLTEGKIDVLINNAYYTQGQSPIEMTDEDWHVGIDGTLSSVFRAIREIIPFLISRKSGKIINVSSMYGMIAPPFEIYENSPQYLNPPHYGAAKAGVIQLTKYYASYLGKSGINVNCVTPGPFPSDSVQMDEAFITKLQEHTLLNRIGKPEDLAGIFVFLSSESSSFITGQNFIVDGGWTAK